jgi:hypothetical protein
MLETSQELLEISQTELTALLSELAILRMEYSALWESWMQQKSEVQKWRRRAIIGWISSVVIFMGGIL